MKKFITMALSLTLALSLAACGGAKQQEPAAQTQNSAASEKKEEAKKSHLDEIKAAGKIVMGTSADYPPYEFHKVVDGKDTIVGWEIEMAELIAKELGVKLEIKEYGFDTLIATLNANKVDFVVSAMTITDKRKESVDFSIPYNQGGQQILTTKEKAATIKTAADLKGKTVAVQLGTTGEAEAQKIEGVKVKQLDKFEAAVLDLLAGKVDAVIGGSIVVKNFEKNNPKLVTGEQLTSERNGIAFRKGDTELVEAVNKALDKLIKDGTVEKLVLKYETAEAK